MKHIATLVLISLAAITGPAFAEESAAAPHVDGKPVTVLSTGTMLVQRTDAGWKIVHIHWSSRTKTPDGHH